MGFVFDIAMLAGGLFVGMLALLKTGRQGSAWWKGPSLP
jgi:hypothetical protein